MQSKRNKLLDVLIAVLLCAIFNFITSGFSFCTMNFIIYHGKSPELFGWGWYFLLVGCISLVLGTGGLLVLSIYIFISDMLRKWSYSFSAAQGILFGVLSVLCTFIFDPIPSDVLPDWLVVFVLILIWLTFTGISILSCVFINKKYLRYHLEKK